MTAKFPSYEQFGLTSQIRRAAVSIPSNIVEGKARGSDKDLLRFLFYARASLEEVKYQTLLAKDLNYISNDKHNELQNLMFEIDKMLNGLIKRHEKIRESSGEQVKQGNQGNQGEQVRQVKQENRKR
jgi:four helix bundle protein